MSREKNSISGCELVRAMVLGGYRLIRINNGEALLSKDQTNVIVPQDAALPDDLMSALTKKADIHPLQLQALPIPEDATRKIA